MYIRPLTVDDAAVSWRWRNDVGLWRFAGNRPNIVVTEAIEREWVARVLSDPTRINFAICLETSNRYIGNIYLVNVKDGMGELGIFIGEIDCHGKGYGQDAVSLLRRTAQLDYGIKVIRISVQKDNDTALISYLKAGGKVEDSQQWINLVTDLGTDDVFEYLSSVVDDFNPAADTTLGMRGYANKLTSRGCTIAAVANSRDRGGIMGILAGYFNDPSRQSSFVSAFHVRIPFRRMHIGRILMDKAVELSHDGGFKELRLKVYKDNDVGISFYERYGFVKTNEDATQFEMSYSL